LTEEAGVKRPKTTLSGTLKQEFKKDTELFENFLVILNNSSPIRNVEMIWADDLDLLEAAHRPKLTTGEALVQIQTVKKEDTPGRSSPGPDTHFCSLVHGFGKHEEQTCGKSDKPAQQRCRETGMSQLYACHVGLMDIAVPVSCDGVYLGTLFSGQVLKAAPTSEGFSQVRKSLAGQPHIDMNQLESAYFRVPIVTEQQLAEMLRTMEVFARYLSNAWKRLTVMSELQRVRERELALDRRELAGMLLTVPGSGPLEERENALRTLCCNIGLEELPNHVLLLRLQPSAPVLEKGEARLQEVELAAAIGSHLNSAKLVQLIEERCHSWSNTFAAVVGPGEICIFTLQKGRSAARMRTALEEMAQALLRIVRADGKATARVGIGRLEQKGAELLSAYREASAALDAGQGAVAWFDGLQGKRQQPSHALARVLIALQAADTTTMAAAVQDFLSSVPSASAGPGHLQQVQGLLTWGCEHLARESCSLGLSFVGMDQAKERAMDTIIHSQNFLVMADAFRGFVAQLRQQMSERFSRREDKIVMQTQRLVHQLGPETVTIQEIARHLQISAGHLGRVYSRTAGHTLEEYLIRQRLEIARRLLLDPRLHVAEVADRSGFCNPAYFASVFKKYMHCSPRAFASRPQHWVAEPLSRTAS
jgi:AraC-like DNA-binding protein/ligand-binding sensor protein